MNLPAACEHCAPFGGSFREAPNGGMERCDCARGMALRTATAPKPPRDPQISQAAALVIASQLRTIRFTPGEPADISAYADDLMRMCESEETAKWLVRRMRDLYLEWPGSAELRIVLCSKHQPLDGMQPQMASAVYPDGIPSERTDSLPALMAAPVKRLTAGESTAAPSVAAVVSDLARATNLKRVLMPMRPPIAEIPITNPNYKPITQADIDRAVEQVRAEKARLRMEPEAPAAG